MNNNNKNKNNINYVIAIPSYDRPEELRDKTLKTLSSQGINPEKIDIFVANKDEEKRYKEIIDKNQYNNMIIGVKGILNQRNFITKYYPENKYIVQIDDDIEAILKKKNNIKTDKTMIKINLDNFIKKAYNVLKDTKLYIWGIIPVNNPYFLYDKITTDLRYIAGGFYGIINRHSKDLLLKLESDKEDFEKTILFYKKDGGVVRFNNITMKTLFYGLGGIQTEYGNKAKRLKDSEKRVRKLKELYPEYGEVKKRPSGIWEFALKKRPKITGSGKKLKADLSGLDDTSVYYTPIEKNEKYEKLKEELYKLLEKTDIPKIEQKRTDDRRNRGYLLGFNAWTTTFGCGNRRSRGISEFNANRDFPELFNLLIKFGNEILPTGFKYQAITLNKDMKAKKHIDGSNAGFSVITGLGEFTGGELNVYEPNGKNPETYNLKDHTLIFNGSLLPHMTTPFKGRRYTIIYYKQKSPCVSKGKKMEGNGKCGDVNDCMCGCSKSTSKPKENKKLKLLELFKGTGSVGKVAVKNNYDVISLDLDPINTPTIETDILDWNYKKFHKENNYIPDFIWASPPCNTFSSTVYPLRERNPHTAEPRSERAKIGTKILYKTLEIINYFLKLNPNLKFVIENPRGMMRRDKEMLKLHNETTLYCLYGDIKRKATDFWSNFNMELLDAKENNKCNKKTIGVQDLPLDKRYSIPSKLIKHLLDMSKKNETLKGSAKPLDKELYEEVKKNIYEKNPKHSIFRSSQVIKEYKKRGGKFNDDELPKMNIQKWFRQKWISVNDYYHNNKIVPCGNSDTIEKFEEYPLCRPLKIVESLKKDEIKKMIDKKNDLKEKHLITKDLLGTDKYNIKSSITGMGKDKFIKQLEEIGYSVDKYLENAKKMAKKEGYDPKKLSLANNNDNKLKYESPEGIKYFGKAGYGDFLIWTFKENKGNVEKGYADKKRNVFRKSHGEITKIYKLNKYSPNELAIRILW